MIPLRKNGMIIIKNKQVQLNLYFRLKITNLKLFLKKNTFVNCIHTEIIDFH